MRKHARPGDSAVPARRTADTFLAVPRRLVTCCAALALTAFASACSGTHHGSSQRPGDLKGTITAVLKRTPGGRGLHIYDARRIAKATVTSADIVRSSLRVVPLSR